MDISDFDDSIGAGRKYEIVSSSKDVMKKVTIKCYNKFPAMLFMQVSYSNIGNSIICVESWTSNNYRFSSISRKDNKPLFWSYLPGSYGWTNDWIQPLKKDFARENYLG